MTQTTEKIQLSTIEEAISDIRDGKVIIVVDDEDRVHYSNGQCRL
jgi:3,4-dihydroxy 2-butanone 4-phosphate synthase/GTP cyclohydrolase II